MTNTLTSDVKSTINQINEIANEGADLVRVSCPDEDSTKALKEIVKNVNIPNGRLIEKITKTHLFFLIKSSILK